jgi:ribosomal protein S16
MGQSICKGDKDAVIETPEEVVDEQLDLSRLPIQLSLIDGTGIKSTQREIVSDSAPETAATLNAQPESHLNAEVESASENISHEHQISPEEVAELDETNYPIVLDQLKTAVKSEGIETALSQEAKPTDTSTSELKDESINGDKVNVSTEEVSPEEAAALDETNFPVVLDELKKPVKSEEIEKAVSQEAKPTDTSTSDLKDESINGEKEDASIEEVSPNEVEDLDENNLLVASNEPSQVNQQIESQDPLSLDQVAEETAPSKGDEMALLDELIIPEEQDVSIESIPKSPTKEERIEDSNFNGASAVLSPVQMPRELIESLQEIDIINEHNSVPKSPTKEERIEDSSFNGETIVSSPVLSADKTEQGTGDLADNESTEKEEIKKSKTDFEFVTNKTEKFAIMDLLASDYMRNDEIDSKVETTEQQSIPELPPLVQPSNTCDDSLTLVQTEKFAILDVE